MDTTRSTRDEETPGERIDQRERTVLALLFADPFPWTVEEIGRELDDPKYAVDCIASLAGDGLVHRLGEFVFPTRAARRSDELHEGAF
jgi:hypothetical protein